MGCAWTAEPPADLHLFNAIETINSSITEGPTSGIGFWRKQLNRGSRLSGIGGGDNHNALAPLPGPDFIGCPTTVIFAGELSTVAILDAIRAGHVFIDTEGSTDRLLEFTGEGAGKVASAGDSLAAPAGQKVAFQIHLKNTIGTQVVVATDSGTLPLQLPGVSRSDQTIPFSWLSDGKRHWLQVEVRDSNSRLLLLGNPIYINFP
ncbi:MAG: hypothetical protein NVS1B11_33990 [Terriglobales bacterium]